MNDDLILKGLALIILTAIVYMAFPLIRLAINRGRFEKKQAKRIALWNSIVLGVFFFIATVAVSNGESTWNAAPALMYYWINCALLTKKNATSNTGTEEMQPGEAPVSSPASIPATKPPQIAENNPQTRSSSNANKASKPIIFCRKCGYKLLEDSMFCSNCGTRVIDVNE